MTRRVLPVSAHPDLAPLVARWRIDAFASPGSRWTVERMTAALLARGPGPWENWVLFEDDAPAGTVGVVHADLESRPDLTPWLAGLLVLPDFRRRGLGSVLVRQAEDFARGADVPVLWLYTSTAEPLYRSLGWEREGIEQAQGQDVVLMRRTL